MSSQAAMTLMSVVEFTLWAIIGVLFWTKKIHRRFPVMGFYLALRVFTMPVLLILFYGQARHWFNDYAFDMYFYLYWTVYIVSAMLLYFVCIEVFRSALSAFSGLQRLGTVVFRWVTLVSVIASLSAISWHDSSALVFTHLAFRLMKSVSILELCLLGFLCLSMQSLRLSARSMAFGISMGFGLMSANDLIVGSLLATNDSLTGPLQFVYQSTVLAILGVWVVYAALPEPVRKPLVLPAGSAILRWNEIASAFGHTGTQVAVHPTEGFVLAEVERVVEGVLSQNLKKRESET
jgi:hypothetical protein